MPLLTLLSSHNSIVLYRETWPVTLSEEYGLKMFRSRVQICGRKSGGISGESQESSVAMHFMICTAHKILFR